MIEWTCRSLLRATRAACVAALVGIIAVPMGGQSPVDPLAAEGTRGPGARLGHALGYLDGGDGLLLFGGFLGDGQPRADTWIWNGNAWRRLEVSGPSPRRWPAMAYDRRRRRLVLHGGRDGVGARGRPLDDTWEWNGTAWHQIAASGPGGRDHHRMVYDARRDRVVLFGGWDGTRTRSDTWELDGNVWREVSTTGPAPRAAHGMAYDTRRGNVVLFGGSSDTTFFDDTWRWNGRAWSIVDVSGPPRRSFHGMTFDARTGVIVTAGGRRGASLYGDTWTFDGARWQQQADTSLSPRYVYDLGFDAARNTIVFHGGGFMRHGRWMLFDETWVWGASRWSRVRSPAASATAVASEQCYQLDGFDVRWLSSTPRGGRARADSSNVIALRHVIHRSTPKTLPQNEGPRQDVRVPGMRTDPPAPAGSLGQSHWRLLAPDSIEITWHDGRYDSVFQLSVAGDSLHGRVRHTTDSSATRPNERNVTAVSIPCPPGVR